jgi:uncharacterized membrane protein YeiB
MYNVRNKTKKILAALLVIILFVFTAVPVLAADGADEAAAEDTTAAEETTAAADDTTAEADDTTTAAETEENKPAEVSDLSNIIGIIVAVIIGIGAIVLIVVFVPKNAAPKKK